MAFEEIECVKPAGAAVIACPADGVRLTAPKITRKTGHIVQFIRLTIGAKLARGIALTQDSHGLRLMFGTGADAGMVIVSVDNSAGKFRAKRAKSGGYALTINAGTAEGLFALQFPPFNVSPVEAIRPENGKPPHFSFRASAEMLKCED